MCLEKKNPMTDRFGVRNYITLPLLKNAVCTYGTKTIRSQTTKSGVREESHTHCTHTHTS